MNWLDKLAAWVAGIELRIAKRGIEKHFKQAEKGLTDAFCELVALGSDMDSRAGQYPIRQSIRQALTELQVYRVSIGMADEGELKNEIHRAQRQTAA